MLAPNPQLAAALRQVKVPKEMKAGKALIAHAMKVADNGQPDRESLNNLSRLVNLTAMSQIELLAALGEREAQAQAIRDWFKPKKAG